MKRKFTAYFEFLIILFYYQKENIKIKYKKKI